MDESWAELADAYVLLGDVERLEEAGERYARAKVSLGLEPMPEVVARFDLNSSRSQLLASWLKFQASSDSNEPERLFQESPGRTSSRQGPLGQPLLGREQPLCQLTSA